MNEGYYLTKEILEDRESLIKFYNEAFPHIYDCFDNGCPEELRL